MAGSKHSHSVTLQQALILAVLAKEGPLTSAQIADRYSELTKIKVAFNYQYIVTRRMADRGLIKTKDAPKGVKSGVFLWVTTPMGNKRLADVKQLIKTCASFL